MDPKQIQKNMQKVVDDLVACIKGEPGWGVPMIFGSETEPGYAYTVGLESNYNHPELMIYGLPPELMHWAINELGQKVKDGHRFEDGELIKEMFNMPAIIKSCNKSANDNLRLAHVIYGGQEFRVMQIYWPDTEGKFPWEDGFQKELAIMQPVWTIQKDEAAGGLQ